MNRLLQRLKASGYYGKAYADDELVMITGNFTDVFCKKTGLSFIADKTNFHS